MPSRPWSRPTSCCDRCWTGSPTADIVSGGAVRRRHGSSDASHEAIAIASSWPARRSALHRSSLKRGAISSSSSPELAAPAGFHIGERETSLARSVEQPAGIDQPRPALTQISSKRLDVFICRARIEIQERRRLQVPPTSASKPPRRSICFAPISLGEDSSVSLFRTDGALPPTTLNVPDLMGKTYADAQPIRHRSATASPVTAGDHAQSRRWWQNPSDSRTDRIVLVTPGRRLSCAGPRDDRRQDLSSAPWRNASFRRRSWSCCWSAVAVLGAAQIAAA